MKSIDTLAQKIRNLSSEESAIFDRVAARLETLIFRDSDSPEARRKMLNEIERYLKKKGERPTKENTSDKAEYLRFVRNAFTHKSNVPREVVSLAIPMFWTILLESAPMWNGRELSNLLAYATRNRDNQFLDETMTTSSIIRHYQTLLKKFPATERNEVFKELLLSIFVTPQFQNALSAYKPAGGKNRGDRVAY